MTLRINVGCGMTLTEGWTNLDNSISLRISKLPLWLIRFSRWIRLLDVNQYRYIEFARQRGILWANAAKKLPFHEGSVEVVYTSHMLEHLDRTQAQAFLQEVLRVLKPGGVIRISVPDLKILVDQYLQDQDADHMIESMGTCINNPQSMKEKLKYVLTGSRHHSWMYDRKSLIKLLMQSGFAQVQAMPLGKTTIPDSGKLDLYERSDASIYVEAIKPN